MNLSVFLTSAGDHDRSLRELIAEWTRAGLVEPSLWTTVSDWDTDERGVPAPRGYWLDVSGPDLAGDTATAGGVDLTEVIGQTAYAVVRLVVVHLLPSKTTDPELAETARQLADHVRAALAPTPARLVLLNLLVPASGVREVSPNTLQPGWDANIVANPEDRLSPRHANVIVRVASNYLGHAALHCATVGGLWNGTALGPFDAGAPSSAGQDPDPVLIRCFARMIRGGPVVDQLARTTLDDRDGWPPPSGTSPRAVPATDPEQAIQGILRQGRLLADGALLFHPYEPHPPPQPRTIGLLAAIRLLFQRFSARIRRLPSTLVDWTEAAAERQATRLVRAATGLGPGSALLPTPAGRPERPTRPAGSPFIDALGADADTLLDAVQSALDRPVPMVPATPEVWTGLRSSALGLIDGGEIAAPFTAPVTGGHRQVIGDPSLVSPDPAAPPFVLPEFRPYAPELADLSGAVLRSCDPRSARLLLQRLEGELRRLEASRQAADGDEDGAADESDAAREVIAATIQRLQDWINSRDHSLLWRFGELLGNQIDRAVAAIVAALDVLADGPPGPEEGEAGSLPGRRLRRALGWDAAVTAVLLAVIGSQLLAGTVGTGVGVGLLAAVVVVGLVVAAFAYLRYCRAMFQLEHRLRLRVTAFDEAFEAAYQALCEISRLSSLYVQYLDWADILGWLVHHPWGDVGDEPALDPTTGPDLARMPKAFGMATASTPVDQLEPLASRFSNDLFHGGWLTQTYLTAGERATAILRSRRGLPDSVDLRPEVDTPAAPNGSRTALLEQLRTGNAQRDRRNGMLDEFAHFCEHRDPGEILADVQQQGGSHVIEATTVDAFLTGAIGDPEESVLDRAIIETPDGHEVDRLRLWVPPAYAQRPALPSTATLATARVVAEPGRAYLVGLITMESSRPLRPSALSLFARAPVPPPRPSRDPVDIE
jgi:hypothetical protein